MKMIDYIGSTISLRAHAVDLFKDIEACPLKTIELDFAGVDFMGRSFTSEMLYRIRACGKTIAMKNMNDNVAYMMNSVIHPKPKTVIVDCDNASVEQLKL
jgi:hypothetical protein